MENNITKTFFGNNSIENCTPSFSLELNSSYNSISKTTEIFEVYINKVTSAIGVPLNIFYLVVLSNKELKHSIYNHLWCRVLCNLLVCLFGIAYTHVASIDCETSLFLLIVQWYINAIPLRISICASVYSDCILMLNRCFVLDKKINIFTRISRKVNLSVCYLIPICFSLPSFFAIKFKNTRPGLYVWTQSNFGTTKFFIYYFYGMLVIFEIILPLVTLIVLTIIFVVKFGEIGLKKSRLNIDTAHFRRSESRYTLMILILSSMCVLIRLFDMATAIPQRLLNFDQLKFPTEQRILILFFRTISYWVTFMAHALEGIIYLVMDSNLKKIVNKVLNRCHIHVEKT